MTGVIMITTIQSFVHDSLTAIGIRWNISWRGCFFSTTYIVIIISSNSVLPAAKELRILLSWVIVLTTFTMHQLLPVPRKHFFKIFKKFKAEMFLHSQWWVQTTLYCVSRTAVLRVLKYSSILHPQLWYDFTRNI